MSFHENLIRARRAFGMTQEELAAKLNVSRQAVSKWETNESLPDLYKLAALADALGTTTDALCGHTAPNAAGNAESSVSAPSDEATPPENAAPDAVKQIKRLRIAVGVLLAVCIVLGALTARALVRERTYAELLHASEEAVPALPDTIEVSGLKLSPDGVALVVSFVPSISGEGIDWLVGITPSSEYTSVTTTVEDGICTARIVNLSSYSPATLSATVTNGRESRSVCLATQVNVGENRVSWTPEV